MALTIPETPFVKAPNALKPAKIGINGKAPPRTLGKANTFGSLNFFFPPLLLIAFRAPANAVLITIRLFFDFFSYLFLLHL